MDQKEQKMIGHYKILIEENNFDEYDILAFLILIRRHLNDTEYPYIKEFSHLVAHRKRDRGSVNACIAIAKANGYQTEENGKTIRGYHGMQYNEWKKEWKKFGEAFGIIFTDRVIDDLTLCVFSLAQYSQYESQGRLELMLDPSEKLSLVTKDSNPESPYIIYSMFGKFQLCREIMAGHFINAVEAVRSNGELCLRDDEGFVLKHIGNNL